MALPQHELFDPDGELVGVYEARAECEHKIEHLAQAFAAKFRIDDSKWRAVEAAEMAAQAELARVRAAEALLASEETRGAELRAAREVVIESAKAGGR